MDDQKARGEQVFTDNPILEYARLERTSRDKDFVFGELRDEANRIWRSGKPQWLLAALRVIVGVVFTMAHRGTAGLLGVHSAEGAREALEEESNIAILFILQVALFRTNSNMWWGIGQYSPVAPGTRTDMTGWTGGTGGTTRPRRT